MYLIFYKIYFQDENGELLYYFEFNLRLMVRRLFTRILCVLFIALFFSCQGLQEKHSLNLLPCFRQNVIEMSNSVHHFRRFMNDHKLYAMSMIDSVRCYESAMYYGMLLTDVQKRQLLSSMFDYTVDAYRAIYFNINQISEQVVSVAYVIHFYKMPSVYIITYDLLTYAIIDAYDAGVCDYADWFRYSQGCGYYYRMTTYLSCNTYDYDVVSLFKEYRVQFDGGRQEYLTYKDSVKANVSITPTGYFVATLSNTIVNGQALLAVNNQE